MPFGKLIHLISPAILFSCLFWLSTFFLLLIGHSCTQCILYYILSFLSSAESSSCGYNSSKHHTDIMIIHMTDGGMCMWFCYPFFLHMHTCILYIQLIVDFMRCGILSNSIPRFSICDMCITFVAIELLLPIHHFTWSNYYSVMSSLVSSSKWGTAIDFYWAYCAVITLWLHMMLYFTYHEIQHIRFLQWISSLSLYSYFVSNLDCLPIFDTRFLIVISFFWKN